MIYVCIHMNLTIIENNHVNSQNSKHKIGVPNQGP